ncbi:MAG: alpha/beta hydrolase [Dehalococcoidia bacterium]
MIGRILTAAAALSAPGIVATIAAEQLIRPRLFYSGPWHPEPPDALGVPYEEAHIYTADGFDLQGWYFPAARPGAPTVLFMHGTSYNASDMWVTPERAEAYGEFLRDVGCNFLLFDYRGYGRNAGVPSEEGTYVDAAAALGWLYQRDGVDPASIFFYGFSLGTGIASELAMREQSAGLILRAPFTSIRGIMLARYPRLRPALELAPWLPLTNYDTRSKIRRLDRPLLVMHGEADTTVPERLGQQVFEAAPEPKRYVSFPDTAHSQIRNDLVVPAVSQFIDDVLSGAMAAGRAATHASASRAPASVAAS